MAVLSPGCDESGSSFSPQGEPSASESMDGDVPEAVEQPKEQPTPPPPGPSADPFEAKLEEVRRLQAQGEFRSAQILVRIMRASFSEHQRVEELAALELTLDTQRDLETRLREPLTNLGSEDVETVRMARSTLRQAGKPGWPLLRKLGRQDTGRAGVEAVLLLADLGDPSAGPMLLDRYRDAWAGDETAEAQAMVSALRKTADEAEPALIAECHRFFRASPHDALADVLLAVWLSRVEQDEARYNILASDPNGFTVLREYVTQRLASDEPDALAWAGPPAAGLGLTRPGLRADFYQGVNFDKRVTERLVTRPHIANGKYPLKRSENVSVKWTGRITIIRSGRYSFYPKADDGQRIMVNGEKLIDDWTMHAPEERAGSIELASRPQVR